MIGRMHTWKIIVNVVLQTLLQRSLFHEETMRLAGLLAPFHFHSRQYIRKYCCEGSGPRWAEEDCCATIARRRCNNCHFGRPVLIEMEAQIHVDGNPLATDSTIQITKRSLHYALLHDRDLCKGSKVQGLNPLVFIRRQFLIPSQQTCCTKPYGVMDQATILCELRQIRQYRVKWITSKPFSDYLLSSAATAKNPPAATRFRSLRYAIQSCLRDVERVCFKVTKTQSNVTQTTEKFYY